MNIRCDQFGNADVKIDVKSTQIMTTNNLNSDATERKQTKTQIDQKK